MKQQYNLRLEKDLLEKLRSLAIEKGITVTDILIKGAELYLQLKQ